MPPDIKTGFSKYKQKICRCKENRQNKKYLYQSNIMMAMNGTVWGIRLPWRTDLDKARGRNEGIKYEKRWFVLFKRAKLAQTGGQARFNTLLNIFQCKTWKLWQKNSLWIFSCRSNYHSWLAHQKNLELYSKFWRTKICTVASLFINTVSFYALLERCDGKGDNLKVAGSENDSNGQF